MLISYKDLFETETERFLEPYKQRIGNTAQWFPLQSFRKLQTVLPRGAQMDETLK